MKTITIPKPFDAHYHFRDDFRLEMLIGVMAKWFSRATAMPNTVNPIVGGPQAQMYKSRILKAVRQHPGGKHFEPVMTIYITPMTRADTILLAWRSGVKAAKLYPKHGTTGAGHGISDFSCPHLHKVFEAMAECGMLLLIHGEVPDPSMDPQKREAAFKPILEMIVDKHPRLKIVFEHISSKVMVDTVLSMPETVAASVTAHHLFLTWDQVEGNPHNLCMPVAKSHEDRQAVKDFVISGSRKALFGSDGAPHPRNKKEGVPWDKVAFGVYPGEVSVSSVIELMGAEHPDLKNFLCRNAEAHYGLEPTEQVLVLEQKSWVAPEVYAEEHESGGVVSFRGGETMHWGIKEV